MDNTSDLLRDTASKLFAEHTTADQLRAAEQGVWPAAAWAAIEEAGLHRALVPEEAGGYGLPVTDAFSLVRIAGKYALPLPLAETLLASWILAAAELEIPDGPLSLAPVAEATLNMDRTPSGWHLTGTAARIPWGRNVPHLVALAEHDKIPLVALIPSSGWQAEPGENLAREPRDTLTFDAALPDHMVAIAPIGPDDLRRAGASLRALQISGALTRITAMTTQYAQDRVQFGRPIGKFQAVQQNLAIMAGHTAAAIAASDLAAEAFARGLRPLPMAAAKSRCGEAAGIAAGHSHQIHGAIGFTYEHSLHFFTKRLWSWRDEFGNEAEWNLFLGRHMARAGADSLWAALTAA